jgi:hypothetical protein
VEIARGLWKYAGKEAGFVKSIHFESAKRAYDFKSDSWKPSVDRNRGAISPNVSDIMS